MLRALTLLTALVAVLPSFSLSGAGFNPETGSPVFQHYSPDQYSASEQNWAIAQDHRGVMYFGNTDGVLEFDGFSWRTLRLSNGSWARSLAVGEDGTVYVGGVGDFGFLQPDRAGENRFVSLLDKVPVEDRKFADLWRILPTPNGIYFSAYERLFRLNKDGSIKVWRPVSRFGRAIYVLNALYVKTPEQGLVKMEGDRLSAIAGGALFAKVGPTDAISMGDHALIATQNGLYRLDATGEVQPFRTAADSWLAKNLIYAINTLPGGEIAAGTRNGGLALLNDRGYVDRILSKSDGLPGDFVESIFADRQGGLWVAGLNGLTRFNPGLSGFAGSPGLVGDMESTVRQGGSLYVGTTSGLFRMVTATGTSPRFERVAGINTTVWALLAQENGLLAATATGVFSVSGTSASLEFQSSPPQPFNDISGSIRDHSTIYAAGLGGVFMLRRNGNSWRKAGEYSPAAQEFRSVVEDGEGKVWATTRDAVWQIDFRENPARADKFGAAQGVPVVAGGWINARRLQDHITFATSKGLRRYSENMRRFAPDVSLGDQFADGSRDVFNIFEDRAGDVWVTGEKYHGVLLKQANGFSWYPMPLESAGIKEIYWMYPDDDGTAWAFGNKGVLYRWERALAGDPDKNFNVLPRLIQAIHAKQKDTLYGGAGAFEWRSLPWQQNNLHFEFAAPFYEDPRAVEYQSQLVGFDSDWSQWSTQTWRDYTYLPEHGSYQLLVRARTPHGTVSQLSEQSAISFGITPPWYRSWWAYSIYMVLLGFGVWGIVRWRTQQLKEDKKKLEIIVEERTVEIRQQRDEIHVQERKSHSLLLNILPAKVADELKATGAVQPVGFEDVTVCFTDFVGFTLSSEKMPPAKLVDALNEYFTAFDEIIARYGLEKLKTIGDSYMFASGLPVRRESHAVDAVLAALEMADVVKVLAKKVDGTGWNIRIGLHSGPVVAGVVGIRKFAFDIWGNTVNFAARMESSGVHGRVNMSERTCGLTRGLIHCEARGKVKIKEGRELPMFLAVGPVEDFAVRYKAEFGEEPRALPAMPAVVAEEAAAVRA
jgi:class 3 adenylate cyclase/ligand-binding sensor domain-containing protein